jgi:hypothetical protein
MVFKARMFFSEEKNQKTFTSCSCYLRAMAGNLPVASNEKSFGSFLQKRTFFLSLSHAPQMPVAFVLN